MTRYVAIGDSFTEGLGDTQPDGTERGWADLVASGLAASLAEKGETVEYANLAIRGRLLAPIVHDQLEAALALDPKPTMISFNGGGNDMLRRGVTIAHLVELTEHALQRATGTGVHMVVLSGADPADHIPFGSTFRRRGEELTAAVAAILPRYDNVTFVDCFRDRELRRGDYWSADRLHLNTNGHRRVASLVLAGLGHATAAHILDPSTPTSSGGLLAEARYYGQHVLPWINRRLRGRSSGDNRDPKYATWTPITT
ncbi:SGNH/GDSL hydrolase family protein [Actinoplanes derwentensis]|uniref:Lysophospholipase L1 n=1 Tax=Actinoplanes derwentensis TaxID=113562 RepID=A0A1H2BJD1_9ACTN|nr:SGNH/GDSL hydrolase family protein [Actinoplanes derwentensis]GID87844.1 SGNH hydrolase [Actinoplanes derwentensis]SDT57999.1 Lysophospholipase L1 [Actinoplanes derwentensis]